MLVMWVYLVCENSMSSIFDICTFLKCYILGLYLGTGIFCWSLGFLRTASNRNCKFIKSVMERWYRVGLFSRLVYRQPSSELCLSSPHGCKMTAATPGLTYKCQNIQWEETVSPYLSVFTTKGNLSQIFPSFSKSCSLKYYNWSKFHCMSFPQSLARGMRAPWLV